MAVPTELLDSYVKDVLGSFALFWVIIIPVFYKAYISKNGGDYWVKVDVRSCRPEDPMSFTVQTKRAESRESKWITAGKVVVVLPATWGRLSGGQKEEYLNQSFSRF